jgi:small subunit ribosomal protein S13
MPRIAGIDLNDNWRVNYALTKIKGIGWTMSEKVLDSIAVEKTKRVKNLTPEEIAKIAGKLEEFPTEGELLRIIRGNINRLHTIATYRGMRHSHGLPVRGQRTRSNARTRRGKRKTVGAFRKEALAKMTAAKTTK